MAICQEAKEEAKNEENLQKIPRRQRAVLRKALTQDLTVTIESSTDAFYGLYSRTMRDHGTPALPKRYFETLARTFGTDCEVLTVRKDGRPISSVLSYYYRDAVLPYYTGSRGEARGLGSNDLMYWAVMRRAVERGYSVFDFGRSKVGTGPFNFKKNWGFEPRPITHQFLTVKATEPPNLNPTNPKYALMISAWRRLPVPVAELSRPFGCLMPSPWINALSTARETTLMKSSRTSASMAGLLCCSSWRDSSVIAPTCLGFSVMLLKVMPESVRESPSASHCAELAVAWRGITTSPRRPGRTRAPSERTTIELRSRPTN